ncbi:MAG: urease accessory protein [Frankiaceae bacterium]|nr:urease accessory protein [Frankiaceae bacterium]
MVSASLLLLADSRLPAGAHAHSGQLEAAVEAGLVATLADLVGFVLGRLTTQGSTSACAASMAWLLADAGADQPEWDRLDAAYAVRTPSPAQRAASRAQGRSLLRVGRRAWPAAPLDLVGTAPHHAIALGALAWAAGATSLDAATVVALGTVSGPASAAVRLLSFDPLGVQTALAALTGVVDAVATRADESAHAGRLLCPGSPSLDRLAEAHQSAEVRLFAS